MRQRRRIPRQYQPSSVRGWPWLLGEHIEVGGRWWRQVIVNGRWVATVRDGDFLAATGPGFRFAAMGADALEKAASHEI